LRHWVQRIRKEVPGKKGGERISKRAYSGLRLLLAKGFKERPFGGK